jgi:hypothetical protein
MHIGLFVGNIEVLERKKFLPTVCRLAAFAGKLWRRVG